MWLKALNLPIISGLPWSSLLKLRMNTGEQKDSFRQILLSGLHREDISAVDLYHSQTIEGALTTFPGVRIVYPSFADDAAGLLRTSMRSEGFTMFLEPKALYNSPIAATPIPEDFEVPFGKARIRREGNDLIGVYLREYHAYVPAGC